MFLCAAYAATPAAIVPDLPPIATTPPPTTNAAAAACREILRALDRGESTAPPPLWAQLNCSAAMLAGTGSIAQQLVPELPSPPPPTPDAAAPCRALLQNFNLARDVELSEEWLLLNCSRAMLIGTGSSAVELVSR